jgi:hypothetical protein
MSQIRVTKVSGVSVQLSVLASLWLVKVSSVRYLRKLFFFQVYYANTDSCGRISFTNQFLFRQSTLPDTNLQEQIEISASRCLFLAILYGI